MTFATAPPPPNVFIFQVNLGGPPSASFQSFKRSPILGFSVTTDDPPFVLLKIKVIPPKILRSPQVINNDRFFTSPWSYKYGRKKKRKKNEMYEFPLVYDCTQEQNGSPYFP